MAREIIVSVAASAVRCIGGWFGFGISLDQLEIRRMRCGGILGISRRGEIIWGLPRRRQVCRRPCGVEKLLEVDTETGTGHQGPLDRPPLANASSPLSAKVRKQTNVRFWPVDYKDCSRIPSKLGRSVFMRSRLRVELELSHSALVQPPHHHHAATPTQPATVTHPAPQQPC